MIHVPPSIGLHISANCVQNSRLYSRWDLTTITRETEKIVTTRLRPLSPVPVIRYLVVGQFNARGSCVKKPKR
jgi:hypothetical protein